MPETIKIDYSEYTAAINRAYKMGDVRRRDIAEVFRRADKSIVSLAKATAGKSKKGMTSKKYPSRSHTAGALRRGIGFVVSKKQKLVYWVRPRAWYSLIYATGHGSFMGNRFMERAYFVKESQVNRMIKQGLGKLIERTWSNG
jgi:hypothetical protein